MATNFLPFNPTQANQDNDAQYAVDTTRTSGAGVDAIWPSKSANKTLYQLSTGITALMQMMANKGFTCNDTNIATLAAVLANILTTADIRANMKVLTFMSSITCNVSESLGFAIPLSGNAAITLTGILPGDRIALLYQQDGTGGRIISFPSNFAFGFVQPDPTPNAVSVQLFEANQASVLIAISPLISDVNGAASFDSIDRTPIGTNTPASGAFTALSAGAASAGSLSVSGASSLATLIASGLASLNGGGTSVTPAGTDDTTKIATTAWAQLGLSMSLVSDGSVKLPEWLGGFMIQWGTTGNLGGGNSAVAVSFNTPFPSQCFGVVAVDNSVRVTAGNVSQVGAQVISASQFNVNAQASNVTAFWIAVGK